MTPSFQELVYQQAERTRREFLLSSASGLGAVGLGSMLTADGLFADSTAHDSRGESLSAVNPLAPRQPHFDAKAKACIFIFMAGAPSQLDLFDPKPKLDELHQQPLPESMYKGIRFAFLKPETATLMAAQSPGPGAGTASAVWSCRIYSPHWDGGGRSSSVRSMHTDQFNHHPGQLLMQCGRAAFGSADDGELADVRSGQ